MFSTYNIRFSVVNSRKGVERMYNMYNPYGLYDPSGLLGGYRDENMQKAIMYDMLSNYYKYRDPNLHILYYQKHLERVQEASRDFQDQYRHPGPLIRIFHASPGAPSVDIYLNGRKVIRSLAFKQETDYIPLKKGDTYKIDIYQAGQQGQPLLTKSVKVEDGQRYTVAAINDPANLDLLLIADDHKVPKGESKVRFVHLSPDAPAVDIVVKNGDPIFSNIAYRQVTDYVGITPMTLMLEVRPAGQKKSVLEIPPLRLRPNRSYTIYAVGKLSGQPPLEPLLVQDTLE